MNEASLPTDVEMKAVLPLGGEKLMYVPLKLRIMSKQKQQLTQERVISPYWSIFRKNSEKHPKIPLRIESSFLFKCQNSIRAHCEGPW